MNTDTGAKNDEFEALLCFSKAVAAARHRSDLWEIVNEQLLENIGASYYTLCLINDDAVTHSPFLYSLQNKIRTVTGESPVTRSHRRANVRAPSPTAFARSEIEKA